MSGATIIRLEPSTPQAMPRRMQAATFEEAFGEFSEARGRGRARRQKRRMERIQNKDERKRAKREGRIKRKTDRRKLRIEARTERKGMRNERRSQQQEARLARRQRRPEARNKRRMTREQGRQERENYVQEQELFRRGREPEEMDDELDTVDDVGTEDEPIGKPTGGSSSTSPSGPQDTGDNYSDDSSQDTGGGYSDESSQDTGGSYSDDSSQDTGGGYSDDSSQDTGGGYSDEGYADEGYGDEGYGDDSGNYSDEEEMGDYGYEDEGYTDGFDGVTLTDDSFSEMDDNSNANGISTPAGLIELCNKIEWNKELISRLEEKRKKGVRNPSEVSKNIIERKKRLSDLQSDLDMYLGFVADFSGADGRTMVSSKRNGRPSKGQMRKRQVQVANARMKAMKMKAYGMGKQTAMSNGRNGGDVTPIDVELQPEIQKQRIVVPASSPGFSGTGIMGLDNSEDFGARELDIRLGADAGFDLPIDQPYSPFSHLDGDTFAYAGGDEKSTTTKINWTAVLVGVGVGALAIWAVRKYKLLEK